MVDRRTFPLPKLPSALAVTEMGADPNVGTLNSALNDLTFTPILGPECSTLGRHESPDWQELTSRFAHLRDSIEPSEVSTCRFLEAFARRQGIKDIPSSNKQGGLSEYHGVLAHFQRHILRAAKEASALFGEAMKESAVLPSEAGIHEAKADQSDCLIIALAQACMFARTLRDLPAPDSEPACDFASVYDRLVEFICGLTGRQLSDHVVGELRRLHGHQQLLVSVNQCDVAERSGLTLDQVDWLFRLLWCSISSDLKMYPTDSELTFQLALNVARSDRNASLILAAEQRRGRGDPVKELRSQLRDRFGRVLWREQGKGGPFLEPHRRFYRRIAGVLAAQFSKWQALGGNSTEVLPAVAFSTSFDLEFEHALHSKLSCHHVAVPIVALTRAEGKRPSESHLGWLLGTVDKGGSIETPKWKWFPPGEGAVDGHLRGPLVVKLHGSPVHELPSVSDMKEEGCYEEFEHALILPESSYMLNVVLPRSYLPEFCLAQMESKERAFFFMGLPVNEWHVRLRIFDHVFPTKNEQKLTEGKKVVIRDHFDPFWSAPLAAFGVERWRGSLDNLSHRLARFQR